MLRIPIYIDVYLKIKLKTIKIYPMVTAAVLASGGLQGKRRGLSMELGSRCPRGPANRSGADDLILL
jgi:hypothetical protein